LASGDLEDAEVFGGAGASVLIGILLVRKNEISTAAPHSGKQPRSTVPHFQPERKEILRFLAHRVMEQFFVGRYKDPR
jgi:hypothetical protein